MKEPTPEQWRDFVLQQLEIALTPANELAPTTETVRAFVIGAWACAPSKQAHGLDGLVGAIAHPEWKFESFVALRKLA